MKLKRSFYRKPTLEVAENLIGKFLVHKTVDGIYEAEIIETEAYAGFDDKASHASRGMTDRNKIMFGKAGFVYVYLIYGMYHCFNITTEKEDYPAAVLIRRLDYVKCDGPGKLCREFKIKKETHNGLDVTGDILWIEDKGLKREIITLPRVGVDYAGVCKDWPWRFQRLRISGR
ncbi:MAG: DNA-3-methyladenine glycosylase [Patescibacteria group bacterium]